MIEYLEVALWQTGGLHSTFLNILFCSRTIWWAESTKRGPNNPVCCKLLWMFVFKPSRGVSWLPPLRFGDICCGSAKIMVICCKIAWGGPSN